MTPEMLADNSEHVNRLPSLLLHDGYFIDLFCGSSDIKLIAFDEVSEIFPYPALLKRLCTSGTLRFVVGT